MSELQDCLRKHLSWGPLYYHDKLRFMVLALCGEAGELANLVKKNWRGDTGYMEREADMVTELADVANYAFMIAEMLGVDLQAEML